MLFRTLQLRKVNVFGWKIHCFFFPFLSFNIFFLIPSLLYILRYILSNIYGKMLIVNEFEHICKNHS